MVAQKVFALDDFNNPIKIFLPLQILDNEVIDDIRDIRKFFLRAGAVFPPLDPAGPDHIFQDLVPIGFFDQVPKGPPQ